MSAFSVIKLKLYPYRYSIVFILASVLLFIYPTIEKKHHLTESRIITITGVLSSEFKIHKRNKGKDFIAASIDHESHYHFAFPYIDPYGAKSKRLISTLKVGETVELGILKEEYWKWKELQTRPKSIIEADFSATTFEVYTINYKNQSYFSLNDAKSSIRQDNKNWFQISVIFGIVGLLNLLFVISRKNAQKR